MITNLTDFLRFNKKLSKISENVNKNSGYESNDHEISNPDVGLEKTNLKNLLISIFYVIRVF